MFCSKCGRNNDDTASFCNGCGAVLQVTQKQIDNQKPYGSNQSQTAAKKGPKILIIVGIVLTALMLLGIAIFFFGAVIFEILGESRYFAGYVALDGYFGIVNFMFLLDYLTMAIGSVGVPVLVAGFIWKVLATK